MKRRFLRLDQGERTQRSPQNSRTKQRMIPGNRIKVGVLLVVLIFMAIMNNRNTTTRVVLLQLLQNLDSMTLHHQLSHAYPSRVSVKRKDITLVTHSSVNKLDSLLKQVQAWDGGPVSCAVHLQSTHDIEMLDRFTRKRQGKLSKTSFHVILEKPNKQYPMNLLRNLAMNHIESDYFLAMDADFVPDANAYRELVLALKEEPTFVKGLHSKTLYVLPAFERFMPSQLNKNNKDTEITNQMMPTTRQELLPMIQTGEAAPFHEKFTAGHGATNYSNWYLPNHEFSYPIDYQLLFEPYVVAYRYGLPQYWPHFRGFGYNKCSWFIELHYMGYRYQVLRERFVIHKNHPKGGFDRRANKDIVKEWINFKRHIIENYGAPKAEFLEYKDKFGSKEWKEFIGWNETVKKQPGKQ